MLKMSPTSSLLRAALLLGGYILCPAVSSVAGLGVDTASVDDGLRVGPPHQGTPRENTQVNDWVLGQFAEPLDRASSSSSSSIHMAPRSNNSRRRSVHPNRRAALSITTTAEPDVSDIGECILLFGAFCNGECHLFELYSPPPRVCCYLYCY